MNLMDNNNLLVTNLGYIFCTVCPSTSFWAVKDIICKILQTKIKNLSLSELLRIYLGYVRIQDVCLFGTIN